MLNRIICICRSRKTARSYTLSWKHSRPDCIFKVMKRRNELCSASREDAPRRTTPSLKVGSVGTRPTWVKIRYRNLRAPARSACPSQRVRELVYFATSPFQPRSMQMQRFTHSPQLKTGSGPSHNRSEQKAHQKFRQIIYTHKRRYWIWQTCNVEASNYKQDTYTKFFTL